MKFGILACLPVLTSIAFSACAFSKHEKPDEPAKEPKPVAPQLVGRIASIPADKRFVLIQSYGQWKIETGTILTTRGPEERTANLLVTGESLGQFAAADLQSGLAEVGDAVYSRHAPKPVPPSPEPATATQLPDNQLNPNVRSF